MGLISAESIARLNGRRVIASVSGGKDSTAMCLALREAGIEYEACHQLTGWENAETNRYLREELPGYIGPITFLESKGPTLKPDVEALARVFEARLGHRSLMVRWILHKGMFPSAKIRFCTQELKVRPMGDYIDSLDEDVVNAVGVRADESQARAELSEWEEWQEGRMIEATTWRPLIAWTEADVIAIHQRHGIPPNRSYFRGSSRVGCWPCIRSRKSEIRNIADNDPERIAIIRDLERVVGEMSEARHEARGEVLGNRPTWFQAPLGGGGECWPIDKVVEWSRTSHGGRQFELFAARSHELGCVRWGMCEFDGEAA